MTAGQDGAGRSGDGPVAEGQQMLAEQLAVVARELTVAGDVDATLHRIIELAVQTIEGCDHAGISLVVGDHIETPAQNDEIAGLIDRIQLQTGEGPHHDAMREHEVFCTGDLSQEQRWPRFREQVVERTDVRSLLALRLYAEGDTLGSLNLYADAVDAFDDEDHGVASIFATHAAVALRSAQNERRLEGVGEGDEVDVIGTAKGMIMVLDDVDEATALEQLQVASDRTGRPLHEIAEEFVARGGGR